MNKITFFYFQALVFLFSASLKAQVDLPYYCGFDNTLQRNGWVEYKTAATEFSHWRYASTGAYSDPNCISHDFSPSTGITLTDNWFVSPPFSLENGGNLDYIWYSFSGFSTPLEGDTIGVYLLQGSQNPGEASKILLFDFRGEVYIQDNTYRSISDIPLPPSDEMSYLAIRYRNSDCSTRWLTVSFDEISISGGAVSNEEKRKREAHISVHPNPSKGCFTVGHSAETSAVAVFNETGQEVFQGRNTRGRKMTTIDLSDQPKGIYILRIREGEEAFTRKLILH